MTVIIVVSEINPNDGTVGVRVRNGVGISFCVGDYPSVGIFVRQGVESLGDAVLGGGGLVVWEG